MVNPLTTLSELLTKQKEQLKPVVANVERILSPITQFVRSNPLSSGVILGIPAGATAAAAIGSIKKKVTKKSKKKTKKTTKRKTKKRTKKNGKRRKRKYKYARTAGKRRDRSTRRIRMTKNGQPYVILRSGKARFIKKSSARRSRKLKGGRY